MKLLKILIPVLSFILPLSIYIVTLSHTIAPGDSTEMVTAALTLGISHQPSYPVNTLIGHVFSLMPLPLDPVARVNLASAFLQALTIFVFYFVMLNLIELSNRKSTKENPRMLDTGYQILVSFCASQFLAFSLIFWQYATKFEVFSLNNLFTVLILWITTKLVLQSDSKFKIQDLRKDTKFMNHKSLFLNQVFIYYVLLAFVSGMAFTHHQTIILVLPPLLILLWPSLKRLWLEYINNIQILKYSNKQIDTSKINIKWKVANGKHFRIVLATSYLLLAFVVGLLPYFISFLYISNRHPLMNWGDVHNIKGVINALLRTDYGTFSPALKGLDPVVQTTYPIDNIVYYLEKIITDFTIIGFLLIIFGFYFLYKNSKKIFIFIFSEIFTTGFFFLGYANFPLSDSFNQATVRRFHQLPNIFCALLIGVAIYYLTMRINTVKVKEKAPLYGQRITVLLLELSFLFVIAVNFFKANHKPFTITEDYINEAYSYIPDNSLVLVTGDISDMTSDYFKYLKVGNKHIMMFTPGQFHMPWFTQQVVERYPNVVIPLPESDKRFTNATQIIDANYGKWSIYIDPDLVTHSPQLEEKYTLYPEHLLFLVKRKGEEVKLEGYREVNDDMWRKVNLEQIKLIQRNSPMFEETIIFYYCRHFYNVGSVFEDVKLYDDAIKNYMRVLEIDPYFKNALAALGRVYGYKIKEPNYMTAIDYLRKYQSVLNPTKDYELGQSAQSMIEELQGKMQKAAEEEKQLQEVEKKQEATESAKM